MATFKEKELSKEILTHAKLEGFCSARIVLPDANPQLPDRLSEFLVNGWHGQMNWLKERSPLRSNPKLLWPKVKSILVLAQSYSPEYEPLSGLKYKTLGNISVYAHGHDYHDILKKRLKKLGSWLVNKTACEIKVFVDTAPVMEKPLAQASGLGWQGKHTNLVSRDLGNWFFLGVIFTNLQLTSNKPESDYCGTCNRCLEICPTSAFVAPYKLDARKCISYLTIEHKGPVEKKLRPLLGNRIYGCDDCLAVCPWNKYSKKAKEIRYHSKTHLNLQSLEGLAKLSDEQFREKFSASPIKRIGRNRFVRNVLYAIGNSKEKKLQTVAQSLTADEDFSVRDAAVWAFRELRKSNE